LLTIKPPAIQGSIKLIGNPHDGIVRVYVNAEYDETLRLHLEPLFDLNTSSLISNDVKTGTDATKT
jgi:hypothetical protein